MRSALPLGVVAACLLVGCGDRNGARPTPATPVPSSVEVTGHPGYLFLGRTYQFQLEARLTDGSRVTSGGVWGSDAPTVATVDGNGVVKVVGVGEATVYVDYQGQRGARRVQTTVWYERQLDSDTHQIREDSPCTATGWWSTRPYCGTERIRATFTQQENVVTASITLVWDSDSYNETEFPLATVVISPTGELNVQASGLNGNRRVVTSWRLRPVGLTGIAGTFSVRYSDPRRSGYLEWGGVLTAS